MPPVPKYAASAVSISLPVIAYELGATGVHPVGLTVVTPATLVLLEQMLPSKASNSTARLVMKSHRSPRVWPVAEPNVMVMPSSTVVVPADMGNDVAIVPVGALLNILTVSSPSIWILKFLFAVPVKLLDKVISLRPVPVKNTGFGSVL